MTIKNNIFILIACASLIGCLNSEEKSSASSNSPENISTVTMSSVSVDKSCNPSREGSIVYDHGQSQFFSCIDGQWVTLDLRGPKGEKGDAGVAGANGTDGAQGAAGAPGVNGSNGRDGIDGNGIRLSLKENGQLRGVLIDYSSQDGDGDKIQKALMMIPSGDLIYIDANTGIFTGKPWIVYYSEPRCVGEAYVSDTSATGPHVAGRIYVGPNNIGRPAAFYRAEEWIDGMKNVKSYRTYNTSGQMHSCVERESSIKALNRVVEIPEVPSLEHLKPIKFSL